VVLVSKDINLRIKASICNVDAEDYENDRAIDDFNLLFTGATELPPDFWERHEGSLRSWTEKGRTFYEVKRQPDDGWFPNQFLYLPGDDEVELKVARLDDQKAVLQIVDDYRAASTRSGASTRATASRTSRFNALMDPEIDLVTLLGTAGTGKTLLALAAGPGADHGRAALPRDHHDPRRR
jgi:PhoH-like ATPase